MSRAPPRPRPALTRRPAAGRSLTGNRTPPAPLPTTRRPRAQLSRTAAPGLASRAVPRGTASLLSRSVCGGGGPLHLWRRRTTPEGRKSSAEAGAGGVPPEGCAEKFPVGLAGGPEPLRCIKSKSLRRQIRVRGGRRKAKRWKFLEEGLTIKKK